MTQYSFHRYANFFPMMQAEEFKSLVENLKEHGLREKIWLYQGQILDGRNRYTACLEADILPQFQDFRGTEEQALSAVMSWNLERRHLNPGQKSMVALEVLPEFERLAKEKQLATLKQNRVEEIATPTVVANLPQRTIETHPLKQEQKPVSNPKPTQPKNSKPASEPRPKAESAAKVEPIKQPPAPKAREHAAKVVGVSPRSVQTAKKVQEKRPDLAAKVREGSITLNQANTEIRREERIEKIAEIAKGNTQLEVVADSPNAPERFPVIYADPPWRYEHVKTDNRAIENQYPTMSLEEICKLPVKDLATPDAILFLWTTSPKLDESLDVVDSWGFTYRTCAIWDKEKIGMGYYFRQQHELLLVATRGSIPVPPVEARVSSVLRYPRGKHSKKPLEVAELIGKMYPELPKVELFCRSPQPGWFVWGNQSSGADAA